MRTQAMIIAVALITAGGCSDKNEKPAGEQPDEQAPAQGGDEQQEKPDVAKPSTFEVSKAGEGTAVLSMTLPDGWSENQRIRIGKGWVAPEAEDVWITVELDCAGECDPAQIRANVEPIVEAKRGGSPRTGPSQPDEATPTVEQELLEDSALGEGHLIARRFTPPKEVMDPPEPMLEVFCYRHREEMPVYVAVTAKGPADQAGPFQDAMIEACRSLEIAEWKPEG
jgi:hypothetical protein